MAAGEESAMVHSSGLGLWLANWLVNRSGGTLSFEETGESGATARIELPTAEGASGD
jgi:signal transduction histidine kinase